MHKIFRSIFRVHRDLKIHRRDSRDTDKLESRRQYKFRRRIKLRMRESYDGMNFDLSQKFLLNAKKDPSTDFTRSKDLFVIRTLDSESDQKKSSTRPKSFSRSCPEVIISPLPYLRTTPMFLNGAHAPPTNQPFEPR